MAKEYSPRTKTLIRMAKAGIMSLKDGEVLGIHIAPEDEKIAHCYPPDIAELLNNGAKVTYLNHKVKPDLYHHEVNLEEISFRSETPNKIQWVYQRLVNRIKPTR